jgi:hypothetical protein
VTSAMRDCDFEFRGHYRVQSRRAWQHSALRGTWRTGDAAIAFAVNRALDAHSLRSPGRSVALRTASVVERAGTFATCPDVLYKRELFTPDPGTPELDTNLVDVEKAIARWGHVAATLVALWGPYAEDIVSAISDPTDTIRREYFAHEAGHLIGVDIHAKTATKHFRPDGRLCWPLVYLEEVRADLHALAIAAEAYPPTEAIGVFHYHVATRFGEHRRGRAAAAAPFGLVPYLLFVALRDVNMIDVVRVGGADRLALTTTRADQVVAGMRACGAWAAERITAPQLGSGSRLDLALVSASHVRACLDQEHVVEAFTRVLGPVR